MLYLFAVYFYRVVMSLSIKRRLFISNILMVVLPIVVTTVLFFSISLLHPGGAGFGSRSGRGEATVNDPWFAAGMLMEGGYIRLPSDIPILVTDNGEHLIMLPGNFWLDEHDRRTNRVIPFLAVGLLGIVFIINRALTKYISHSIITSIDTLVDGVREISEGNLDYRIHYNKGDEFDAVCGDFNEMATRLSEMVNQRQMDEAGRKELIAGISHDLRTPLTSIKAYIEGFRKGVASTPEMREKYLDTIQSKTEDIEYIINQLFLFSKMDIGEFPFKLEAVDIGDELKRIVDSLDYEGLTIELKENVQSIAVSIDIVQFRNVIQNILNNSVKYGNKEVGYSEISCIANNDTVSITIRDNGPGVPEEMLNKIFDVFYRGDASRTSPSNGSGLGLAICLKAIERLNGSIRAENTEGSGLSIIITLPIQKGESI